MLPFYIWIVRLYFFEVKWKRRGLWRLELGYLNRKSFVGKREFAIFKNGLRVK